jgi:putative ATPase
MDLFEQRGKDLVRKNAPLADRMRPRTLDEFFGQNHIVGPGRLLRRAIQIDQLSSVIFYGPPGSGKTTLARIIANTTKAQFLQINAVLAGIKEIRDAIDSAKETLSLYGKRTILFIDEVHRFNKAQQDALLPHVENGVLILIGATTENPYFEVNKALVSRSRIFQLGTLDENDLRDIAGAALADKERGYGGRSVRIDDDALGHLVKVANGDARGVLNALELAVETTTPDAAGNVRITRDIAEESIQQKAVLYDKDGDAHYDTVSAFIKSVRGSDPDAALYWMAKMVYAGEDPRFIFRRMLILACEDVGLADPMALSVVVDAARAFDYVGLPEGRYHLAHACLYLATAPKSNSSMAFFDALSSVSQETKDDVPTHLMDASRDKEGFGHGEGYLYPHAFRDHWVAQQYLPSSLQGKLFFQPSDQGYEKQIATRVARLREAMVEAMVGDEDGDLFENKKAAGKTSGRENRQWMQRTLDGNMLVEVRDRIFELAAPKRDSLVLDLHARTGLLTFEAMRRSPDGSVWSLAHDASELETVTKLSSQHELLARPTVIISSMSTFEKDIAKAAGGTVSFDVVCGRAVLAADPDKAGLVKRLCALLAPSGRMVLSETVHGQGQRLSALLPTSPQLKQAAEGLAAAEEALFSDPADPLVNWTPGSLEKQLAAAGCRGVRIQTMTSAPKRRITPDLVEHWFRPSKKGERKSLGVRLTEELGEKSASDLKKQIHTQFDNRDMVWKTTVAFIKIKRNK